VGSADSALASSSSGDPLAWSFEHDEEVHTEDTDAWVVFDVQVDVFLDAESEAAQAGEVAFFQLVFFHFQTSFEDLFGFWPSDSNPASNLLIPPDTERSYGEPGFRENRALSGQLLQNLGGPGQPITTLTNANVDAKFGDADVLHAVLFSFGGHFVAVV